LSELALASIWLTRLIVQLAVALDETFTPIK